MVHRLLTRLAVENLFHPFQPFIIGQYNLPPKIAIQYNIPLIFYGESGSEYNNPISENKSSKRSWSYFSSAKEDEIFLGGSSLSELRELGLDQKDWNTYMPSDPQQLIDNNIEIHNLGYYIKWHPQSVYYYAIENGGFESSIGRSVGTYQSYASIDDRIDDFHFHTTWNKFGIGRATYDAAQEIRSGDLTREEGIALVEKFDGEFPERWASQIFEYLSVPEKLKKAYESFEKPEFDLQYYRDLSDCFKSPHLWKWDDETGWELRYRVFDNAKISQQNTALDWEGNQ